LPSVSAMLSVREVCKLLACTRTVLARLHESGHLCHVSHEGSKRWLYFAEQVAAYQRSLGLRASYERGARNKSERDREAQSLAATAMCGYAGQPGRVRRERGRIVG
jgi:hypothetical protein